VNYGTAGASPGNVPLYEAIQQRLDEKHGIKLHVVPADSGAIGLQLVAGGQTQIMNIGLSPVILGNNGQANFRIVDGGANSFNYIWMGGSGVTADNAAQKLKGGKVGISSFGSESDIAATFFAKRLDLVRDKDVSVVQTGSTSTRLAALTNGAVGSTALQVGEAVSARKSGFSVLWDMADGSQWLAEADGVDAGYLAGHRDIIRRVLQALADGQYYARSHPDDAKKLIAREFKYTDTDVVDAVYERFAKVTPIDMKPQEAAVKTELSYFSEAGKARSANPADYLDTSLIDELNSSGFIANLRKQYGIA
jgi:ABC-type nitrate/sulfonate/bicarbonate transport system substrate-binding protein